MNIQTIKIESIKPAEYNPRLDLKPGDPDYEKLKGSITAFGYIDPIIWNSRTGNLVGGHQRYKILLEQGIAEVDVSVVDLPLEREKALNLALNKVQGSWDESRLAVLLDELVKIPDFDVSLTGFDKSEMNSLFDEYLLPSLDSVEEDVVEQGIVITQKGDLIELGPHRLLCGDSTTPEALKVLLGDTKASVLYTDVPYNCRYNAAQRPTQKDGEATWKPIENDFLEQAEYEAWLKTFFEVVKPHLASGVPAYVWNGHRQFGPMSSILTGLGFHVSNVITWMKPCPSPGYGDYQMQSEFCLYSWLQDNGPHRWFGPNDETNVWEVSRDSSSQLIHPTQKPVALAQRALKNSSERGDVVLDCFAGSGSTLMAAQTMERTCFAMEIEPGYCDAIVRRYIKLVGPGGVTTEILKRYSAEVKK